MGGHVFGWLFGGDFTLLCLDHKLSLSLPKNHREGELLSNATHLLGTRNKVTAYKQEHPNAFHLYARPSSRGRTSRRGSRETRVLSPQGILGLHSVADKNPILSASSVIPTSTFSILSYLEAAGCKDRNEEFYCLQ